MLGLFKRPQKVLYKKLGSFEVYVSPEETVTIKLVQIGRIIYVIPYDEFEWSVGKWHIQPETHADKHFLCKALCDQGYRFSVHYDDGIFEHANKYKGVEPFIPYLKLNWIK